MRQAIKTFDFAYGENENSYLDDSDSYTEQRRGAFLDSFGVSESFQTLCDVPLLGSEVFMVKLDFIWINLTHLDIA